MGGNIHLVIPRGKQTFLGSWDILKYLLLHSNVASLRGTRMKRGKQRDDP